MNRHKIRPIFFNLLLVFIFTPVSHSAPVTGYSSYINTLPGGKFMQAENFNIIDVAQKEVKNLEFKRRGREINFLKPVNVEKLTPKYLMIAFEVSFRPSGNSRFSPTPAIYALLFEQKQSERIISYTSQYIKWLNSGDIEEYKNADKTIFREYFRHLGVDDCIIPTKTVQRSPKSVESGKTSNKISGDQIASGTIDAKYIDPEIARKKDLDAAIEHFSQKTQEIKLSLSGKGENTSADSKMIAVLQNRLSEEQKIRAKLEKRIARLESLLKNVSVKDGELLIEGLNVHIVNGQKDHKNNGNGKGNIILGYIKNGANEKEISEMVNKISHKIITSEDEKNQTEPN